MQSTGILFAFLGTIAWAVCVFPFTAASRKMGVAAMNLFRLITGTLLVLLVAFLLEDSIPHIFSASFGRAWLWLGASGIVSLAIGDYFSYKMYAILSPRIGSVLTTLSPATALLVGMWLLNEQINIIGVAGIFITIFGVMGMSLGRSERSQIPDHGHGSVLHGILSGVFGALCHGAGLAMSKKGFLEQAAAGQKIEPITGGFIRFLAGTVVIILALWLTRKLIPTWRTMIRQPSPTLRIALSGVFFGPVIAVSFAMSSIQYIDVAIAQTIFALVPVVALLISHFVYKEKITRAALGGVLAAITGVVVLIWRKPILSFIESFF